MKKIIFLLAIVTLLVTAANAQPCKCNPYGFGPFKYLYAGATETIGNMHQLTVKCNTPIEIQSSYKCSYTTTVCDAKLKATIKNTAGATVKTFDDFHFPLQYQFETGGNYEIEIVPWCLGKKCNPVKFYFSVVCDAPAACACNDANGWDRFTAYIDGKAKPTVCGSTFTLKKDQPITIKGGYKCIGSCDVVIKGKLTNTTTGSVTDYPDMKFEGEYKFSEAGYYKLIAVPTCKGKECKPCVFYFKIL